jgi:hypothetical protein
MIGYVKIKGPDDAKSRAYHCSVCGAFIAHDGAAVQLNGSDTHSFVNPAGIQCDFMTFIDCMNVVEHADLYLQHSWFPGYGWRFLTCRTCLQHLGWKYDAVIGAASPQSFFGVLVEAVEAEDQTE